MRFDPMPSLVTNVIVNLILLVLAFVLYAQVRTHGYVWDTVPLKLENPWVHSPGGKEFVSMFTEVYRANWQPLVWLSHALDFWLFGNVSGLHHLSNVAYHAVNACLVYALSLSVLKRCYDVHLVPIATLTAVIFLIHPQHVQSVAWLVERKDTLYVMFTLLAMQCWIYRKPGIYSFAFFIAALMAKPMAVTLPAIFVLLDIVVLGRYQRIGDLKKLFIEKWLYFLVSIFVGLLTLFTQQGAMPGLENLPIWVRCLNAIDNSLFYLMGFIWPLNLSPFYPYPHSVEAFTSWHFWLPGLSFLSSMTLFASYLWIKGRRWLMGLWLFYLITLSPVSGLVQVGPAKALDYYVYLATLPIGLVWGIALSKLVVTLPRMRPVVIASVLFYSVGLFMIARVNVNIWHDEFSLWSRAYQLYPESAYINRNLAAAYVSIDDLQSALFHAELSAKYGSAEPEYISLLKDYIKSRSSQQELMGLE